MRRYTEELVSSDKDNTKRDAVLEERFNGLKEEMHRLHEENREAGAYTRSLFRLNVSAFYGIGGVFWVV